MNNRTTGDSHLFIKQIEAIVIIAFLKLGDTGFEPVTFSL